METLCSSFGLVYWKWIIKFVSFISKKDHLDLDDSGSRRHDGDTNVSYPQARSSIFFGQPSHRCCSSTVYSLSKRVEIEELCR